MGPSPGQQGGDAMIGDGLTGRNGGRHMPPRGLPRRSVSQPEEGRERRAAYQTQRDGLPPLIRAGSMLVGSAVAIL